MHLAVVTSVRTDEDGNVWEYTIMHGRNKRIPPSRSGSKEEQSKRKKDCLLLEIGANNGSLLPTS